MSISAGLRAASLRKGGRDSSLSPVNALKGCDAKKDVLEDLVGDTVNNWVTVLNLLQLEAVVVKTQPVFNKPRMPSRAQHDPIANEAEGSPVKWLAGIISQAEAPGLE